MDRNFVLKYKSTCVYMIRYKFTIWIRDSKFDYNRVCNGDLRLGIMICNT